MPALLNTDCHVCGHRHHFVYLGDDLVPGRDYVFLCPETGEKGRLRPVVAGEAVAHAPQGAVALTPCFPDGSPRLEAGAG
jgi:hypothetical protein